jgi:hypothetical protein
MNLWHNATRNALWRPRLMVKSDRRLETFGREAEGDRVVFPFRLFEWADFPF